MAGRRSLLSRALRLRCPACGVGRVFPPGGWRHADVCASCGWRLERGPGHWVGGNEINMLVTFPTAVLTVGIPALAWGPSFVTAAVGGVLAVVIGLAVHRPARCLFFAIDYLVDPTPDLAGDDGFEFDGEAPRPAPRPPSRTRDFIELPIPLPAPRPHAEPLHACDGTGRSLEVR